MKPEFDPGEYWVGLFMGTPWDADGDSEVAFDYFHSPELGPLAVTPAGAATLVWAALKTP